MRLVHNVKYLRDMIINEAKIYDREYVEKVLGINIPLQETIFGYSSEFRARVIKEHMLYEGFVDTLRNVIGQAGSAIATGVGAVASKATGTVTEYAENVKTLARAMYDIIINPSKISQFIQIIKQKIEAFVRYINVAIATIDKFFSEKLLSISPELKKIYDNIKASYQEAKKYFVTYIVEPAKNLAGWVGVLTGCTIYVVVTWLYKSIADHVPIGDIIKSLAKFTDELNKTNFAKAVVVSLLKTNVMKTVEDFIKTLYEKIAKKILHKTVGLAINGTTAFAPWFSGLVAIVGTTNDVAEALNPITSRYISQRQKENETPPPQTIQENIDIRTLLEYLK